VLVNDFGALDIDGRLVAAHGGDTIALANGCLCCTIGDSLIETLLQAARAPDRFDHIVVEASGVADPARIADLAVLEPRLMRDGVVVVVDAATCASAADDRVSATPSLRQIKAADLLVLNKVDVPRCGGDARWLSRSRRRRSRGPARRRADRSAVRAGAARRGRRGRRCLPQLVLRMAGAGRTRRPAGDAARCPDVLRAKGIVRFADAPDRADRAHRSAAHRRRRGRAVARRRLAAGAARPEDRVRLAAKGVNDDDRPVEGQGGDRGRRGSSGPGWGNGKCTAVTFAREGARVMCVDLRRAAAEETVGLIARRAARRSPGRPIRRRTPRSRRWSMPASPSGAVSTCSTTMSASARPAGPVELCEDEWDRVFDVNVKSFFLTAKHVLPVMEKQGKGRDRQCQLDRLDPHAQGA
jgi:hypothetical protein